jgi:hypothetical protein
MEMVHFHAVNYVAGNPRGAAANVLPRKVLSDENADDLNNEDRQTFHVGKLL